MLFRIAGDAVEPRDEEAPTRGRETDDRRAHDHGHRSVRLIQEGLQRMADREVVATVAVEVAARQREPELVTALGVAGAAQDGVLVEALRTVEGKAE